MAGWDQAVGPALLYAEDGVTVLEDESQTQLLTADQDGTGFEAAGLAKIAVAGDFTQTATWAATDSESIPSTAGWSQDATWDAVGLFAVPVTSEATFDQAAASWLGATSELAVGNATWQQDASWDAEATNTEVVSAEATFDQGATWDATAAATTTEPESPSPPASVSIRGSRIRSKPQPPLVLAISSFGQGAEWAAQLTVNDDALVLALV